jgi:mono/diheme cytochrome c family protein
LSGCSFRELKQVMPPPGSNKLGIRDFRTVSAYVFQPKCVDCHGAKGGVNLETYSEAIKNLQAVKAVLENRAMPPRSPLSSAETEMVLQWIADGAPEVVAELPPPPGPSPTNPAGQPPTTGPSPQPPEPQPPASGLVLSFENVSKQVFRPSCTSCHGTKGGVNLETYQATIESLQPVKDAVSSGDMPPRSRPVLTDSQKTLLLDWIAKGAPEFTAPVPGPLPTPVPTPQPPVPLEPTFTSLNRIIFRPRCVSCHSPGGRAEWLPLDSWAAIVSGEVNDDLKRNKLLSGGRRGDRDRRRGKGLIEDSLFKAPVLEAGWTPGRSGFGLSGSANVIFDRLQAPLAARERSSPTASRPMSAPSFPRWSA